MPISDDNRGIESVKTGECSMKEINEYDAPEGHLAKDVRVTERRSRKPKKAPTFKQVIDSALNRKMKIKVSGKTETLAVGEVIIRRLFMDLAKGDLGGVDLLLLMASHLKKSGGLPDVEIIIKP